MGDNKEIYQYYGRAKDMPKRMRKHFEHIGVSFKDNEWISVNEYVEYSLENRWFDKEKELEKDG